MVFLSVDDKKIYLSHFHHQSYQLDSYLLFLEKGINLINNSGCLAYIIPNPWLINLKLNKIRKFITDETSILNITHYTKKVFDATVDNEVIVLKKSNPINNIVKITIHENEFHQINNQIPQKELQILDGGPINIFLDDNDVKILNQIKVGSLLLKDICRVVVGVKPYQVGKGNPPQTKDIVNKRIFDSLVKKDKYYKPLIRGSDIEKYLIKWTGNRWIKYGEWLAEPRYSANFQAKEKIVIRQTGDSLIAAIDTLQFVCMNNLHIIHSANINFDLKYILGLINSVVLNYYYQSLNPEVGEALAEVKKENVEKLLIWNADKSDQKLIISLVTHIIDLKKKDPNAHTLPLEAQIDGLVAHLYGLSEEEFSLVLSELSLPDPVRVAAANAYRDVEKRINKMKAPKLSLQSFRLRNFKAVQDSGLIRFTPLTSLIGNNGSGKSSLIEGLEMLQHIVMDGIDEAMEALGAVSTIFGIKL